MIFTEIYESQTPTYSLKFPSDHIFKFLFKYFILSERLSFQSIINIKNIAVEYFYIFPPG